MPRRYTFCAYCTSAASGAARGTRARDTTRTSLIPVLSPAIVRRALATLLTRIRYFLPIIAKPNHIVERRASARPLELELALLREHSGSHEEEFLIPGGADDPVYRALGFPAGAT